MSASMVDYLGFHANELQLLLGCPVHLQPGQQTTHTCLDLNCSLLLCQHLHQSQSCMPAILKCNSSGAAAAAKTPRPNAAMHRPLRCLLAVAIEPTKLWRPCCCLCRIHGAVIHDSAAMIVYSAQSAGQPSAAETATNQTMAHEDGDCTRRLGDVQIGSIGHHQ